METSIVHERLSDGSLAYNVVFVEGSQKAVIACASEYGAHQLQVAFAQYAAWVSIERHRA